MNRAPPPSTTTCCTSTHSTQFHFLRHGCCGYSDFKQTQLPFGSGWGRRRRLGMVLGVVSARVSRDLGLSFGLDSQTFQSTDVSQLRWLGPIPGDIAEVEAYCRECFVSYDSSPDEKPLLEDKIASVFGCMVSLLNKDWQDVLSGRSSMMASFRVSDMNTAEHPLPPLALFRGEIKRC